MMHSLVNIKMPQDVVYIIETLQQHGYEAYAVGGCVRDSILGREPQDWDITTSAMPEETKALFPKTFDTGIEHGTITILMNQIGYEVTTYRIDGKYEDGRHPKEVTFTRNLREDLLRRDFTINAMAYNDKDGLVDLFGGIEDLNKQRICCVGDAKARLAEDALRILRGIRFAAQLGFTLEEETTKAMKELAPSLKKISAERIQVELVKTVTSNRPEMLRTAYELGITKEFLPEFDVAMETTQETKHHMYTVGEHSIKAMAVIRNDKVLRLTMLLHDIAKPVAKRFDDEGVAHFMGHNVMGETMAKEILRRLKFDNDTIRKVTCLVRHHDDRIPSEAKVVRKTMNQISEEMFPLYMEVRRADVLAQSMYLREEKIQNLDEIEVLYKDIIAKQECVSLKSLAVTGNDLIKAGVTPGKEIGRVLNQMLDWVIENPTDNQKELLLARLLEKNDG